MNHIEQTTPLFWAICILSAATVFTITWLLDAATHKELVKVDITDKELQTHRNILLSSILMEASLVGMFWFPLAMLPFFIAFFLTRTAQEFIDELHYHTHRCSPYESTLHLVMWMSAITKTVAMFIWGFFSSYDGFLELPFIIYLWALLVLIIMSVISYFEWRR